MWVCVSIYTTQAFWTSLLETHSARESAWQHFVLCVPSLKSEPFAALFVLFVQRKGLILSPCGAWPTNKGHPVDGQTSKTGQKQNCSIVDTDQILTPSMKQSFRLHSSHFFGVHTFYSFSSVILPTGWMNTDDSCFMLTQQISGDEPCKDRTVGHETPRGGP